MLTTKELHTDDRKWCGLIIKHVSLISFLQLAAFCQQFIKEMCYVMCYVTCLVPFSTGIG